MLRNSEIRDLKGKLVELEEQTVLKSQEILDLNNKFEQNQVKTALLSKRFEAEMTIKEEESQETLDTLKIQYSKEKEEMQSRLKSTIESNNQKETEISQLKEELKSLKNQIAALDSELVIKNDQIAQNTVKIQESTDISIDKTSNESSKIGAYMMRNGKICEINEEEGEIKVVQREKNEERHDFIFWVEGKQLCGVLNQDDKWILSLYSGPILVNSLEIVGNDIINDKFVLIGNRVYIGVCNTWELYRVTIEGTKMKLEDFGQTSSNLSSVCEYKDYFFVGLFNCTVEQVKEGEFTTILDMSANVGYVRAEDNYLFASDYFGKAVKYNLITETIDGIVTVGNYCSFLMGYKIARTNGINLCIYSRKSVKLTEFTYSTGDCLYLIKQTEKYSILAFDTCLLTINHITLEVKQHATGEILYRYLNY